MKSHERLKMTMDQLKISQEILSSDSGVSQPTIHRMIKGTQNLNFKVLNVLRNKYKVDLNIFFEQK
ncbi:helix-turn-helix domain-containing protein [Pedobacter paludis]|uniref:HTH cro/C1-type domain-containing protein n=1 Tax=Pedobacter paludis TaxID=2203212 RepID=A0A317EYL1_9SPHI|nr:helix-turn-helix transcriptional regulator [Pedobacter paludis]PWS30328.1 hypothetical protein DF947_18025 [Pedobacter paludis]